MFSLLDRMFSKTSVRILIKYIVEMTFLASASLSSIWLLLNNRDPLRHGVLVANAVDAVRAAHDLKSQFVC